MIGNPNPIFIMDLQSNQNPITVHLIKENLKMRNIKLIIFFETLLIGTHIVIKKWFQNVFT